MSTEKQKESSKKYYYKNKEKVLERQHKYRNNKYKTDSDYRKQQLDKASKNRDKKFRDKQFNKYVEIIRKINREFRDLKYICGIADFNNKYYFSVLGFDFSETPDETKTMEFKIPIYELHYDLKSILRERISELFK